MSEDEIIKRLDALIEEGIPLAKQFDPHNSSKELIGDFDSWSVEVTNVLDGLLPLSRIYLKEFRRMTDLSNTSFPTSLSRQFNADGAVKILKRLRDEISSGYTARFNDLIAAEIFADFIDMSVHLCEKGYLVSAASLSTAVLEDGLRRIAKDKKVPVEGNDTLGPLNDKCAKKGVYSKLWHGRLSGWAGIRNDVDHGLFEKFKKDYKKEDIQSMTNGIKYFLAEYLK